jgi:hypothetical protein
MRWSILALLLFACAHEPPPPRAAVTRLTYAKPAATAGIYLTPPPRLESLPLDEWRPRYPEAARTLDAWRETYPAAAQRLIAWAGHHSDELRVLVDWAITHPYERIGVFFSNRMSPSWRELNALSEQEPEGLDAFLHWARLSRVAAEELSRHADGLDGVARSR